MEAITSMCPILVILFFLLWVLSKFLTPVTSNLRQSGNPKTLCENFFLKYAGIWIPCFAFIVASGAYELMGKWGYFFVCGGLACPLLLQPVLAPSLTGEGKVPLLRRHCTKANVWIATFSFLGNYWGTHYFYCVLGAQYTLPFLPDHQLNGVPICMYFATHFYFCFYHALANKILRFIDEHYLGDEWRTLFVVMVVCVLSYVVAFMETFSISAFPYYTFQDREKVYTVGSVFYALYLIVSFPMFMRLDCKTKSHTLFEAFIEALATWMAVMMLLEAVRLILGIEFRMAG
eukprot:TRINITY_DN24481_c0_g1_i1.p1 TRINITY_DN24481_c0_g1~~TRINITY_DN24481_c0_g1_i1.p1  ORF type:complete len:289 (-),score=29.56 TRINITY_DN24481_c0_g1_i1:154-1020(-)